jgi:prepilin signal peptidase PulO-like enzyme (type II secretory pathway)
MGSFVNALVWRVHEQDNETNKSKPNKKYLKKLSIKQGRSMCPHCKHELTTIDLVPVFSWLTLKGRCRYCKKRIPIQYPIVESATALMFVASYSWWPRLQQGPEIFLFGLWLLLATGLVALFIYDLRWQLLPNRITYPLGYLAAAYALTSVVIAPKPLFALTNVVLSVGVGGGIFYVLFQISEGKWIGGGDVKLGWLLGLIVGTPARALLIIFIASVLGTLVSLPLLAAKKLKPNNTIPFGPYLIMAAIIVVLVGHNITEWYQNTFFNFSV